MEIINYTPPTSWDDKGMNWDDPDPINIDYFVAIYEATKERYTSGVPPYLIPATLVKKGTPVNFEPIARLNTWIIAIAQTYAVETALKNIYTIEDNSFVLWTQNNAKNAMGEIACRLATYNSSYAYASLTISDIKKWLKEVKIFVNGLRYKSMGFSKNGYGVQYSKNSTKTNSPEAYADCYNYLSSNFPITTWSSYVSLGVRAVYSESWPITGGINHFSDGAGTVTVSAISYSITNYSINVDVYTYYRFQNPSGGGNPSSVIFDASQTFPDDEIEVGKYCKVSVPCVGGVVDFRPFMTNFPNYPLLSELPSYSLTQTNPAVIKGWSAGDVYFIADYSKSFNFK